MKPVPVVLVTGFLGSGKTTLLRRLAEAYPDRRMVFLVNEYAETSVDGETLAATGRPTHNIVGGSLFCECKAGDFLRTMQDQVLGFHRESPIDSVIIETSGTADPDAIGRLMAEHGLSESFELRSIITVVAPAKLPKLLGNLPVVEAQLLASDCIILNKTDTVTESELETVEASVRRLNPEARLLRATYCGIDLVLPEQRPRAPDGELATCDANPFTTVEVVWPCDRPRAEAEAWLRELPETILRIKGRIRTAQGIFHVERTADALHLEPASTGPERLVLIAHDDHESALDQAIEALHAKAAS